MYRYTGRPSRVVIVLLVVDLSDIMEFKFVLKPVDREYEGVFEEGPNRILKAGVMSGGPGLIAKFNLPEEYGLQRLELPVSVVTDQVSPFALAASWRALKKNIKPHGVRLLGIPDVSLDQVRVFNSYSYRQNTG